MTILYVLKLKHECYYVGTTQHPITNRVKMHLSGFGSKWTRIHPPIALVKQMHCADHDHNHDSSKHSRNESHNRNTNHNSKTVINLHIQPRILEDMHVKHLMFEFGIDHVRGGSYSKCDLSSMEVQALRRELWYARNCCTRCGRHRKERDRCSGAGALGVGIGSCRISLGPKTGLATGSVPVSVRGCHAERDVNGLLISTANTGTTVDEDEYEDDDSLQADIEVIGIRKGACGVDNGCRSCSDDNESANNLKMKFLEVSREILDSKDIDPRVKDYVHAAQRLILNTAIQSEGEGIKEYRHKFGVLEENNYLSRMENRSVQNFNSKEKSSGCSYIHSVYHSTQSSPGSRAERTKQALGDPSLPARGSPTRTRGSFTKPNSLLNDGAKLSTVPMTKRTPLDFCTRCKRSGHTRPDCNETSDRFGFDLTDFMF